MSDRPDDNARETVYRIRDLKKDYPLPGGRKLEVLQGVDLDIDRGDLVVIQGTSGIGKSTLLHVMGLLDRADSGVLEFEGVDLARASTRKLADVRAKNIGIVFQFYHLLPEFTALENVTMPGKIARSVAAWVSRGGTAKARGHEVLDRVGLGDRAGHRPNQLSGGERQRVALARALFNEPAVLLCDEPTGNLDVKTSEAIHELLSDLNRETGQTMVIVTHDPGLADYASRVVHIDDGRAVEAAVGATPPPLPSNP